MRRIARTVWCRCWSLCEICRSAKARVRQWGYERWKTEQEKVRAKTSMQKEREMASECRVLVPASSFS